MNANHHCTTPHFPTSQGRNAGQTDHGKACGPCAARLHLDKLALTRELADLHRQGLDVSGRIAISIDKNTAAVMRLADVIERHGPGSGAAGSQGMNHCPACMAQAGGQTPCFTQSGK
ncbi:hypothetical protein LH442_02375 [Laribacter hongkongensis]|uniref:hypothetical protein n=1 Tax=Laribacter hongkongensis TaxID=168471 RepID=UPI001EFC53FC|nr:hypothetical protein [Laribacter hongkongensis]MCG9054848.1 hypothetical protein [Laribacter hongkongensis]